MNQRNFTYAEAESCYYEEERISTGSTSEYSSGKEGNALIDPSKTHLNVDLIPHHPALNPDDYHKHHRGLGIAEYHKQVTGRTARMHGDKKQLSKAVGCIITLPRDYLKLKYNLTDEEYIAIERYVESGSHKKPKSKAFMSAMEKISQYSFNENELRLIIEFLSSAFRQWQKNAGIRDEDILFAKIHFDETWPHIHIMALPTVEKEVINIETGEAETMITYSTSKFNNAQTHYFDRLHENIIRGMLIEDGIDASGLLNGATKGKGYTPADFNHNQREEGVEIASVNRTMADRRKKLTEDNDELEAKKTELSTDISRLQVLQAEMEEEFNEKKQKCKNYLQDLYGKIDTAKNDLDTVNNEINEKNNLLDKLNSAIKSAKKELKSYVTDKIKQIKSAADTAIHSILKAVTKEDKEKAANAAVDNLTKIQTDAISTLPGWDDLLDEDEEMEHEVEEKE